MSSKMGINAFFTTVLKAPLKNPVWSWGAYDEKSNRVFLRDNYRVAGVEDDNGGRWAVVYDPNWRASQGHAERMNHLDLVRGGVPGYGVVVEYDNAGHTRSYDDATLLEFGEIVDEDGLTYARILRELPIEVVIGEKTQDNSVVSDIEESCARHASKTQQRREIEARLGQGQFRDDVLRLWGNQCSVTDVTVCEAIRASHIKPWKDSTDSERLDPRNGLPLVATLDALFDVGLITFDRDGKMKISSELSARDRRALALNGQRLRQKPHKETARLLALHEKEIFQP